LLVIIHPVPYKYGDTIRIKFFQDLHIGSPLFDKTGFKNFLADMDDKTYLIGNGDIFDMILATDPRYKKGVENCTTEAIVDEQIDEGYQLLKPYADRIISIGIGNHEETIVKHNGTNPIRRLCEKLSTDTHKVEYLGMAWMIRLNMHEADKGRGRSIVVYGHHGYGGGTRTEGGSLTKFSKDLMYQDADIYLFGHVHEKLYKNIPRGYHGGTKYLSKDRLLIIGGCFKKNLTNDDSVTWEETKGFPIRSIGGVSVHIKPTMDWVSMRAEG
jgi:hypothetical protein